MEVLQTFTGLFIYMYAGFFPYAICSNGDVKEGCVDGSSTDFYRSLFIYYVVFFCSYKRVSVGHVKEGCVDGSSTHLAFPFSEKYTPDFLKKIIKISDNFFFSQFSERSVWVEVLHIITMFSICFVFSPALRDFRVETSKRGLLMEVIHSVSGFMFISVQISFEV